MLPLGLGITWAIAFVLIATGVYSYKGCDANIPACDGALRLKTLHMP